MIALLVLLVVQQPRISGPCDGPAFRQERRDQVTIERLEYAWNIAYLRGDTASERCLLSPSFTEVMRSGAVKRISDEIGFAARNIGRNLPLPKLPAPTILIDGDAAVAFTTVWRKTGGTVYADFYVWKDGVWRAYFAQQTAVDSSGS